MLFTYSGLLLNLGLHFYHGIVGFKIDTFIFRGKGKFDSVSFVGYVVICTFLKEIPLLSTESSKYFSQASVFSV